MRRGLRGLVRGVVATVGGLLIINVLCAYLLLGKVREPMEEEGEA